MQATAVRPQAEKRKSMHLRTLVLNADGTPLSTWPPRFESAQEAVHGVYRDRFIVIENWPGEFYRSPSTVIPVPKTVMLREYAPIRGEPKFCRRSVYLRDRYRCQYCGERFEERGLTLDHVIPRSKGGKTVWDNVLTCCHDCNAQKRDSMPNYSGRKGKRAKGQPMRPLKMPRRPTTAELLRAGLELLPPEIRETWADTLYWGVPLLP